MSKVQPPTSFFFKSSIPQATQVLDTYWKFACERQEVFFNRVEQRPAPWTDDAILLKHKFTNAYRASDRVSQYLIKHVIYKGSTDFRDVFFRTLLFKLFNKIETWELLKSELGEPNAQSFDIHQYSALLLEAVKSGETIYSGAYIMASGKSHFGHDYKFQNHLALLRYMLDKQVPEQVLNCKSLEELFLLLKSFPTIGNFLAYQFAIDLNYSEQLAFSEMDFVMPGPGARDGIRKCFSSYAGYSEADLIRYVTDLQEQEFERLGLNFRNLWGRSLQLIDSQNLFCEVDKYARVAHPEILGYSGRQRIKQLYKPHQQPMTYFFPPKWDLRNVPTGDVLTGTTAATTGR